MQAIQQSLVMAASAFFGFFRLGELLPESPSHFNVAIGLAWGGVEVDSHTNPTMIQFHFKVSKCDQFGAGSNMIVGRTDSLLVPVIAILQFINIRGDHFLSTLPRRLYPSKSL